MSFLRIKCSFGKLIILIFEIGLFEKAFKGAKTETTFVRVQIGI